MAGAVDFSAGGYQFLPSVFQFSAGVAALSAHAIERVRFRNPVPLKQGFERIEQLITQAGRPLTSFCACELRSPAPFTEQGFRAFNEIYVVTLQKWGLFYGKVNPVARSNVCPEIDPPAEPSFHAFSFTRPSQSTSPSFVISGSGEAREGGATYSERTVRYRDLSPDGVREKVRFVVGAMESRMGECAFGWKDATAAQAYTVHGFHHAFVDELVRRGTARSGLTWHFARPPVIDLEYEMDCRRVMREVVI